jgi:hypothetical protein
VTFAARRSSQRNRFQRPTRRFGPHADIIWSSGASARFVTGTGIATCKTCGGLLVAFTRDYKRGWGQRGRFYGCSFNQTPAGSARFTSSAGSELDLPFEGAALCG